MHPKILFLLFSFFCSSLLSAQISPDFTSNFVEICAPGVVQFTDNSTANNTITQWEWKKDGVSFSNLQNPSLFFNTPGSYSICLITTDNLGNIDSLCRNNYITAYRSPSANFSVDATVGCDPLVVHFTDLSTLGDAPIQSWRWDFGDGNIDSIHLNPTHTYTTIGNFDVTLVVVDTNGCSSSILNSNLITVYPAVTANITHNAYQVQCGLPTTVNFYGNSTGSNLSYTWSLGDNNTASNQNISHAYLAAGCYSPTLVVSNGFCSATATVASCITVTEQPNAAFTLSDTTNCSLPFNINISNQSTHLTSFSWSFGDGGSSNAFNPSHSYTSYSPLDTNTYNKGVFPVILNVSNAVGCIDSDTQFVYISNLNASVDPTNLPCAPDTAYYRGNSMNISPAFSSVNWIWTLDNMLSTNGSNATAYYLDSGTYNAQVIITDNIGCIDTANKVVNIGRIPTIDSITIDTNRVCRITGINFNGYGSSYIDFWNWSFSDNSSGSGSSFLHDFQDTGTITGTLSVGFRGCLETINLDTYYILPPIAQFSYVTICDSLMVNFIDGSIGADRWHWDFGDSTTLADTSSLPNPSYLYPDTGIYFILLIVYNDSTGCVDSFRNVVQMSRPIANFSIPDSICTIGNLQPINLSQSADAYLWTAFGAVPFSVTSAEPSFEYRSPGIFPLTLTAFAPNGCFDTLRQYVYVAGLDTNIIHSVPICRPAIVTFTDSSTGVLSPIVNWQWSNGSTQNVAIAPYSFPGNAAINLQVTNDWGCTFDLVDSIEVGGAFINFTSGRDICLGSSMTAVALTNSPANGNAFRPFTYIWDFGDGTIDTTFNTVSYHTYTSAGLYDVCLDVVDMLGCVTTLCRSDWVEVYDPAPLFTADTFFSTCPPLEVNFSNLSLSGGQWSWNFGDGSVSTLENPTHIYSTSGFYDVILEITAFPGCSNIDTIPQMIQITGPTGHFISSPQNSCAPYTAEFIGTGSNIATYTWLFGNGDAQSNTTNAATDTTYYTYTQAGSYVPILVLDDGAGCQIPIQQDTIFIRNAPSPHFTADSIRCQMDSIHYQLLNSISNNTSIEWSFEGGFPSTSTQANPSIYYPDSGTFDVQVILTLDGCSDTLSRANFIQIKAPPIANFGITMPNSCAPVLVQFSDSSTSAQGNILSLSWDFGNNQTSSSSDTTLLYTQVDTFLVQLLVENNAGCKDSLLQTFSTAPSPIAQILVDTLLCLGDTLQLNAFGGQSYAWTTGLGLSDSSISNPFALPTQPSTYTVVVLDRNNCSDTASISVHINTTSFTPLPDQTICLGDSALLSLPNGINPLWSGDSLSCLACLQTVAYPSDSSRYQVAYYDPNNCLIRDSLQVQVLDLSQLTALGSDTICLGDTLQLAVSGNNNAPIQWLPNYALSNHTSPNPLAYPSVDTQYIVQIRQGACLSNDSINIYLRPSTEINTTDIAYCIGDSAQLIATGNSNNYHWSPSLSLSDSSIQNPIVTASNDQIYQVVGTGICNTDTAYTNVQVQPYPSIQIDSSMTAILGSTITLHVSSNSTPNFDWSPSIDLSCTNCPNPSWVVRQNQTFYVTATNNFGCPTLDSIHVRFISDCTSDLVFVPNAFTPDSDGYNDVLYAQSGLVEEIENFQIYNRWGTLLFETDNLLEGWDGSFKGKTLAPDVFGYFLIFRCPNTGEKMLKKGNVTILR